MVKHGNKTLSSGASLNLLLLLWNTKRLFCTVDRRRRNMPLADSIMFLPHTFIQQCHLGLSSA
jgi:hypothetical protein